ncbi:hypothetical protein [Aliarcobacter thereius]|uniref:Uncharacterized protein n=2 Tax=Aliarcobacter thereius TaxID=544718 RepID=A0A1C0B6X0_9BACT|nr:hypothetical protein [Aliarcobacter thereius]OCL91138.1 hypothetical protein AAX25_01308 [Aliarcobacter thereius]OCL96009.1 hypothetical protein AA347_01498 [Aliarcobacter thereius LMG 24486]OCL99340.1 hypothetical protein AAX29_01152 [Aliarcobacter thereius]QBF16019.1 hypothetical protein ATH_0952 [Aliarcobacter thereius LMG 24486]TLS94638.1 hypothetical protein FE244_00725 [Aliarcobacter thereius]
MTNSETISKLNDALTRLMGAYQELQIENNELKQTLESKNKKISSLEEENSSLTINVNELKNNTEDDKTTIYSMLGQIENILNKNAQDDNIIVEDNKVNIVEENLNDNISKIETIKNEDIKESNDLLAFAPEKKEKENINKLDPNDERLSSLLGIMQ